MTPLLYQWCIVIAAQLAAFSVGGGMGNPAVLLYQLRKDDTEIPLDLDTSSWIGSVHGLAGVAGIIAPVIMQWRGRKFTFIAACLIVIIGWVLIYTATGLTMILVSETLHGFATNVLVTVSFDYLSEMITPAYRNVAVQSYGIFSALGVATAGILTKFLYWKGHSIIFCLSAVISALMSCMWLESPLWLAYKEDIDKSKINFTKIRGTGEHSLKELQQVIAAYTERSNRNKASNQESATKRLWQQVTRRDFIMPSLHIALLLNNTYWSGCPYILFYCIELISNTTQSETAAFTGGIIINLILVIGTTLSSVLIKIYKNKPVLLISTCGSSACLLCVSIIVYLQEVGALPKESLLSLYFLVGYMISCSLGQMIMMLTMSAELMPVKHRGTGGVVFAVCVSMMHGSSLKISPYLIAYLGMWETFLIFILNSIICGLLIWKYVPETKGKTLQEIENFYVNGTFEIKLLVNESSELINIKDL